MLITGLHIEQGFCVPGGAPPTSVLIEAREVLDDAEDGCHLHLHEDG